MSKFTTTICQKVTWLSQEGEEGAAEQGLCRANNSRSAYLVLAKLIVSIDSLLKPCYAVLEECSEIWRCWLAGLCIAIGKRLLDRLA